MPAFDWFIATIKDQWLIKSDKLLSNRINKSRAVFIIARLSANLNRRFSDQNIIFNMINIIINKEIKNKI